MKGGLRAVFLGVPLLWVAVAHLGPLLAMARISLLDVYPGAPDAVATYGMAAYASFFTEAANRASMARSLVLAAGATVAALLLSYPLAYHVARHVPPHKRRMRLMLLVAPFWTSGVLRMFALALLLANRGALNTVLRAAGLTGSPLPLLYGTGSILLGLVYAVAPAMLLPLYAALDRMPADVLDAASSLGAGAWRRFWRVTLPLTARGIAAGTVLTFLASLGIFTAPALLGGPTTPVFATTVADLFGAASGRWPAGAAFGFILLLVGTACAAGFAALPGLVLGREQAAPKP